ncbi:hypothetical protein CIB84_003794, partial [Bambusicola thoracicus]
SNVLFLLQAELNPGQTRERHHQNYRLSGPLNVGNAFPRLLNSEVEQKEDTGGHTPLSVIFLAQEKKIIMR